MTTLVDASVLTWCACEKSCVYLNRDLFTTYGKNAFCSLYGSLARCRRFHGSVHLCVYVSVRVGIYAHTQTCMCTSTYVYVQTLHLYMHKRMNLCTYMYVCKHIYVRTYARRLSGWRLQIVLDESWLVNESWHMNESCSAHTWEMSHTWMSHVTHTHMITSWGVRQIHGSCVCLFVCVCACLCACVWIHMHMYI